MAAVRDGISWSGGFPVRRTDGSRFPALVTDAGVYRDGALRDAWSERWSMPIKRT